MPSDQTNNYEQRLRDLYVELRSLRTIVDVLRDEIIKTNKRVQMLEGGVRPSLVPPHPEPEWNTNDQRRAIKR